MLKVYRVFDSSTYNFLEEMYILDYTLASNKKVLNTYAGK